VVDVGQPQRIGNIFGVRCGLADRGGILRSQPVGHAHLVEIGVADEGEQAAVLVLPAEAAYAGLARSLQDRNLDGLPVNPSLADARLLRADGEQRLVIDRFDEAVAERIEGRPERSDGLRGRHVFLRLRNECAIVDDGAPSNAGCTVIDRHDGIHKHTARVPVTGAELGELARPAAHGVLMTFCTRPAVVHGPQAGAHIMDQLVDLLVERIGVAGGLGDSVAGAL